MRIRFPILVLAALLAAAILMAFRDELHARGPRLLNRPAEPVTECGFWGDMGGWDVLPMKGQLFYCPARRCIAAYALTFDLRRRLGSRSVLIADSHSPRHLKAGGCTINQPAQWSSWLGHIRMTPFDPRRFANKIGGGP